MFGGKPEDLNSKLFEAAYQGNVQKVKALIAAGANVNTRNQGGDTALMLATLKGYDDVVKVLIDAEADVNARNNHGLTALGLAEWYTRADVAQMLRIAGAIKETELDVNKVLAESVAAGARLKEPAPEAQPAARRPEVKLTTRQKRVLVLLMELGAAGPTAIGKELKVQGIIFGNVTEMTSSRSGSAMVNTVTLVIRMVETETGATVWSATNTSGGRGFWGSLFGGGDRSESEAIRDCVKGVIKTLIK